jgi:hypothetical protein
MEWVGKRACPGNLRGSETKFVDGGLRSRWDIKCLNKGLSMKLRHGPLGLVTLVPVLFGLIPLPLRSGGWAE